MNLIHEVIGSLTTTAIHQTFSGQSDVLLTYRQQKGCIQIGYTIIVVGVVGTHQNGTVFKV